MEEGSVYRDDALDNDEVDTTEFGGDAIAVVRQVVVASLEADGKIGPRESAYAVKVVRRFGVDDYDEDALNDDLVVLTRDGLFDSVRSISGQLGYESKVALVDAAVAVSCADGNPDRWELSVAREVGEALGFPRDQIEAMMGREIERRQGNPPTELADNEM